MEKSTIILLTLLAVSMIVAGIGIAYNHAANTEVEKTNYFAVLDVEGVNSNPPRLTNLRMRLIDLEDEFDYNPFPIEGFATETEPPLVTTMNGEIELVCEGFYDYQEVILESNRQGGALEQRYIFRNIPPGVECIARVEIYECFTDFDTCKGGTEFVEFSIPE